MEIYAHDHGIGGLVMPDELSKIICDYARPNEGFKDQQTYFYTQYVSTEKPEVGRYITIYDCGMTFLVQQQSYSPYSKTLLHNGIYRGFWSRYCITYWDEYENEINLIFKDCMTSKKQIQKVISRIQTRHNDYADFLALLGET